MVRVWVVFPVWLLFAPLALGQGQRTFNVDAVRCRAAAESAAAKAIVGEIKALRCSAKDPDDPARICAERVLTCLAEHARNQDAADAMIAAYKLVSIDERARHLATTAERVIQWRQAIDKLLETGVTRPDDSELQKQQDSFPDASTRLELGREKLQLQISSLLNFPIESASDTIVNEILSVQPGPVNVQEGICKALQCRCDLKAIRQLCPCIRAENLDSARKLMAIIQPGLGLELKVSRNFFTKCFTKKKDAEREAAERRKQCYSMLEARERQIRTEVVAVGLTLEEAYERLRLAEQLAVVARQRISLRRKIADLELGTSAAVIRTELEAFAAEDALFQRRVEAREEEIRWTKVQGRMLEGCSR